MNNDGALLKKYLELLNIREGDLIFLHTSYKRIQHLASSPERFISILLEQIGKDGTLVMPSFAWNLIRTERPWKGYREYFNQKPVFDVVNTCSNIGVVPETFRKMPGVGRSLNYFWPVCAKGPLAKKIITNQETVTSPYGPGSSFDFLRSENVKIAGFGVTLNTTSLALIPDYVLGERHPQQVFTKDLMDGVVIDEQGNSILTRSIWLLPEIVKSIKPSALIEESEEIKKTLCCFEENDVIFFSYPFTDYYSEALRYGEIAIKKHKAVPWLKEYPLKK